MEEVYKRYINELETGIDGGPIVKLARGCTIKDLKEFSKEFIYRLIEYRDHKILEYLLNSDNGLELDMGYLNKAFEVMDFEIIKLLVNGFRIVDLQIYPKLLDILSGKIYTSLDRNSEAFKLIIWYITEQKADYQKLLVIIFHYNHCINLIYHLINKHEELIKDSLVNIKKAALNTILGIMIANNYSVKIIKKIIDLGADINTVPNWQLGYVVQNKNLKLFEYLMKCYDKEESHKD